MIVIVTAEERHKFCPLDELKEKITSDFNELLKKACDKLAHICRLDKHIWSSLDAEEVQCEEKLALIDQIRDEQVNLLTIFVMSR